MKRIKTLIPTILAAGSIMAATPIVTSCNKSTTYTLSFETNGGSTIASQNVKAGELAVEPKDPTKTGYVFDGWYKDSQLSTAFNFKTDKISSNTTVYAKWTSETGQHIKKLTSAQTVEIKDQNLTSAIFTFEASDATISTETLTCLVKTHSDQTTNFSVEAKGYVDVTGTTITLNVEYSAASVSSVDDECKFDVYFTNTEPNDTWAECFKDLSVKYVSPILNSSIEEQGYVFASTTGTRKMSVQLAQNSSFTTPTVSVDVVSGSLTVANPTATITNNVVNIQFNYDSTSMTAGTTSYCVLTLTLDNYTQEFPISFTAADTIIPINSTANAAKGSQVSSYYCGLSLPLGANETISDIETIEIVDVDSSSTITPVLYTTTPAALDDNKDYITFYVTIKDSKVVKNGNAKFSIHIKKKNNSGSGTGYTTGWEKTISGLELNYTGKALTMSKTEYSLSESEPMTTGGGWIIGLTFETSGGTFTSSELPSEIKWKTTAMSPKPSAIVDWERSATFGGLYVADSKAWGVTGSIATYECTWEFNPLIASAESFPSDRYTHTISITVYWGTGTDYTVQDFEFTCTATYQIA